MLHVEVTLMQSSLGRPLTGGGAKVSVLGVVPGAVEQ